MAIFGTKREHPLAAPSAPLAQSTLRLDQLFSVRGASAVSLHPSWNSVPQRPTTSDGPPQYQPALGQENLARPRTRKHKKLSHSLSKLNLSSVTNLLTSIVPESNEGDQMFNYGLPACQQQEAMEEPTLRSIISAKFNSIVTLIDGEKFSGDEAYFSLSQSNLPIWQQQEAGFTAQEISNGFSKEAANNAKLEFSSGNYFSKVYLYANSRLQRSLPPLKLYVQLPTLFTTSNQS
jgi:hypothetical protein